MSSKGKMVILTAPSGSGKTTIASFLLRELPSLTFSISATNRPKRDYEINGRHYYFYTDEEFKQLIAEEKLAEWEEVYPGRFYGTLKSEIERARSEGLNLLFDIDVNGALNLKSQYGDNALSIFIKVPDIDLLEERLIKRGSESEKSLAKRIERARYEYSLEEKFDKVVLNEDLSKAQSDCLAIVRTYLNQ